MVFIDNLFETIKQRMDVGNHNFKIKSYHDEKRKAGGHCGKGFLPGIRR